MVGRPEVISSHQSVTAPPSVFRARAALAGLVTGRFGVPVRDSRQKRHGRLRGARQSRDHADRAPVSGTPSSQKSDWCRAVPGRGVIDSYRRGESPQSNPGMNERQTAVSHSGEVTVKFMSRLGATRGLLR